ncbi:transmembrane sensor [Pedobacter africanus]|uniref:Ferric-dicitrate binding protein FerR (Iron transport regulator) n=1 Tax=Pedobacter africanus TaxID=151894 RepID=A0ACC6KXG7_9SPHI|nr:FecR domain-containing protein [Pedobacter africanus]MDR6783926.1 ferric-dicitrate binding protein FerR (iron transport regulator) [Pedobacter africanus]
MDRKEFEHLAAQFLKGKLSTQEERRLFEHYDALQQEERSWDESAMGVKDEVQNVVYGKVLQELAEYREPDQYRKSRNIFLSWKAAAALIAIVSVAALFFYVRTPAEKPLKKEEAPALVQDIGPGSNKAVLTLADGSQVALDSAGPEAVYHMKAAAPAAANEQSAYNTISTPLSGQYQLVLADGSKVWLNANSSIRFPIAFSQTERSVAIKGEVYFEIAKDKKRPFKVQSGTQQLEVLGTHFNVNAYDDEAEIKTTLLEGMVRVSARGHTTILKPGQQARLSGSTGQMDVVKVDIEEAVSWKNGYFIFDNEEIHSVMRKISRWYGVEVVYANAQISENFGGTISKFENVSQVLKILEATGTIHFKIEGRKIIVM